MRPEMSLVLLTVLGGIGQGIFILTIVLEGLFANTMPRIYIYSLLLSSLLFQGLGGIASIFHLGNPKRGWKAIRMIRQSWLSREAMHLGGAISITFIYLVMFYFNASYEKLLLLGFLGVIVSFGFLIASSMLYVAISYIKEWANIYTLVNFILSGILGGTAIAYSLALLFLRGDMVFIIDGLVIFLILLTLFALVVKLMSYKYINNAYESSTLRNALGINDHDIRLMDTGCAYDNYNTKEYFYKADNKVMQERLVIVFAFVVPLFIWLFIGYNRVYSFIDLVLSLVVMVLVIFGFLWDRRLFFIEGNHLQNLYYNNFRVKAIKNPILTKAKRGTPIP